MKAWVKSVQRGAQLEADSRKAIDATGGRVYGGEDVPS